MQSIRFKLRFKPDRQVAVIAHGASGAQDPHPENSTPEPMAVLGVPEPRVRAILEKLLRTAGMEVVAFGSLRVAIDVARVTRPVMVLLDLILPSAEGSAALDELCRAGLADRTVVLSSSGSPDAARHAMRKGMCGFLPKPFSLDALMSAVRNADLARPRRDGEG